MREPRGIRLILPIRLGIIGAGGAVRTLHWPVLEKLKNQIRVAAIASRGIEKARGLATLTGAGRTYPDYRELLADSEIDAVLTAVPIIANGRILLDSISSGKHVIAEKPLAATLEEGQQVLKACAATSKVILIAENYRYRPDLPRAREILGSGAIGEVAAFQMSIKFDMSAASRKIWTETNWRQQAEHSGGFLLDAGVHPVSFLRDLLGDVEEVFARTLDCSSLLKGPDGLLMQLGMETGATGQFLALYAATVKHETPMQLSIFGSRGTLELSPGLLEWTAGPTTGERIRVSRTDRGYGGQWRNFIAAIRRRAAIVSTPERAFGDMKLIAAALQSASDGKPVRLREFG